METSREARLLELAGWQHGVFSRQQWLDAGLPATTLRRRVLGGRYEDLGEGALAVSGAPRTFKSDLRAATLVVPDSLASHQAAAELHELPSLERGILVVTTWHANANTSALARVRRTSHLPLDDRCELDGIPVTSLSRTVLDLARVCGSKRLTAVIDHVLSHGLLDVGGLFAAFDVYARPGRPRIRFLRLVLTPFADASAVPHSVLERVLLDLIAGAGLPTPVVQFRLPWREHLDGIADLAWPALRVIAEADGRRWHSRIGDFERDRHRDNVAQAHGWRVLRFTYAMLTHRRTEVVDLLRHCLDPPTPPGGWH